MTHIDIILTETEQRIAKHIGSAREASLALPMCFAIRCSVSVKIISM